MKLLPETRIKTKWKGKSSMVRISIENPKPVISTRGRKYVSFWVRIFDTDTGYTFVIAGWKFYPDTGTISTPSMSKEKGKFFNTTKTTAETFNKISSVAYEFFTGEKTAFGKLEGVEDDSIEE